MKFLNYFLDLHYNGDAASINSILKLLDEYDLKDSYDRIIALVKEGVDVSLLAANTLKTCNDTIAKITDSITKKEIEDTLAEFNIKIVGFAYKHSIHDAKECVDKIKSALQTTCKINNYDYEKLSEKLKINNLQSVLENIPKTSDVKKLKVQSSCKWIVDISELERLASKLVKEEIIKNDRAFVNMLSGGLVEGQIIIKRKNIDLLIVLFDKLIEIQYIKRKTNKGQWKFLAEHIIDPNARAFKEKTLANRLSIIKTDLNLRKHHKMLKKVNDLLGI